MKQKINYRIGRNSIYLYAKLCKCSNRRYCFRFPIEYKSLFKSFSQVQLEFLFCKCLLDDLTFISSHFDRSTLFALLDGGAHIITSHFDDDALLAFKNNELPF